jgi:hypothetical protein
MSLDSYKLLLVSTIWARTFLSLVGCHNKNWQKLSTVGLCTTSYLHNNIISFVLLFDHIQLVTHLAKHCLTAKGGCIQHWYENQSHISFSLPLFYCCPEHWLSWDDPVDADILCGKASMLDIRVKDCVLYVAITFFCWCWWCESEGTAIQVVKLFHWNVFLAFR